MLWVAHLFPTPSVVGCWALFFLTRVPLVNSTSLLLLLALVLMLLLMLLLLLFHPSCTGLPVLLQGLLSAAARKKTSYRTAALAALQQVLDALPPLMAAVAVDGASVWQVVSPPMLQALQQQLEAASKPPASAAAAAEGGGVEEEVKPLPLVEACK